MRNEDYLHFAQQSTNEQISLQEADLFLYHEL